MRWAHIPLARVRCANPLMYLAVPLRCIPSFDENGNRSKIAPSRKLPPAEQRQLSMDEDKFYQNLSSVLLRDRFE